MTIDELNKQTEYNATEYVNDSAPDIDAEHLNKNEQKLKETVQQANNIIDTLKALISDVQTESSSTVPSSSLVYQMQQQIDSISQGGVSGDYIKKSDISNVQVNDQNKVPSSALAYSMQQQINETNSNLEEGLREAITESDFEIVDVHTLNNYAFGSAVRCGRMVIVCFSTDSAASTPGKGTFFTLPENFRPPAIRYGMGIFANASNTDSGLTNRPVYVDISGNVCNPSSAAVYRGGGTIVYIK